MHTPETVSSQVWYKETLMPRRGLHQADESGFRNLGGSGDAWPQDGDVLPVREEQLKTDHLTPLVKIDATNTFQAHPGAQQVVLPRSQA